MKRLILIMALLAQPVWAENQTGNDILSVCTQGGDIQTGFCVGYTIGTWEGIKMGGFRMAMLAMQEKPASEVDEFINRVLNVCVPAEVENGQVISIFTQYLQANPATRHNTARHLLIEALSEAFPCE